MAQPQQPPTDPTNPQQPPPPTLTNPRFTLELEFVSSLANPYYLSHLAVNYPNLLGISQSTDETDATDTKDITTPRDPDAAAFAAYLAYLYSYWKTPEYAQFLTHPGATLRALRLLQEENFRRDVIRPDVVEALASNGLQEQVVEGDKHQGEEQQQDQSEQQDGKGS